jgi:hypothetical protein
MTPTIPAVAKIPVNALPTELWLLVFERFSYFELIKCMRYCQHWTHIILGNDATRRLLFLGPLPPTMYDVDPTSYTMTTTYTFSKFVDDRDPSKPAPHVWEVVPASHWISPPKSKMTFHPFVAELPRLLYKMNPNFRPRFKDPNR